MTHCDHKTHECVCLYPRRNHVWAVRWVAYLDDWLAINCSLCGRVQLKCDGTRAETRFRLSAKRTSPFKSADGRQFSRLLAAEVCASAVVMLDTPCSEVVWRVLATYSIRQFPLHFPSRASPCAITFQLDSTLLLLVQFMLCTLHVRPNSDSSVYISRTDLFLCIEKKVNWAIFFFEFVFW